MLNWGSNGKPAKTIFTFENFKADHQFKLWPWPHQCEPEWQRLNGVVHSLKFNQCKINSVSHPIQYESILEANLYSIFSYFVIYWYFLKIIVKTDNRHMHRKSRSSSRSIYSIFLQIELPEQATHTYDEQHYRLNIPKLVSNYGW